MQLSLSLAHVGLSARRLDPMIALRCGFIVLACVATFTAAFAVHAQEPYPTRAIRLVVPTAAGAGSDIMARAIVAQLGPVLGQPMVVDNRPGAAGTIGLTAVKIARPDGYTLAFANTSSLVNAPLLADPPAYGPTKDFEAVAVVYRSLLLLISNAAGSGATLKEFFDHARAHPAKLNYASPGPGSFAHFWIEMMKRDQKIDLVHVPYKGAGPAFQAILANEVNFVLGESTMLAGGAASKVANLKILAQMGKDRGALLPNVPTVREAGYPELTTEFWFGVVAPKGTPARIVRQLNEAFNKIMAHPEVKTRMAAAGGEPFLTDPDTFGRMIAEDTRHWAPIAKTLSLK